MFSLHTCAGRCRLASTKRSLFLRRERCIVQNLLFPLPPDLTGLAKANSWIDVRWSKGPLMGRAGSKLPRPDLTLPGSGPRQRCTIDFRKHAVKLCLYWHGTPFVVAFFTLSCERRYAHRLEISVGLTLDEKRGSMLCWHGTPFFVAFVTLRCERNLRGEDAPVCVCVCVCVCHV